MDHVLGRIQRECTLAPAMDMGLSLDLCLTSEGSAMQ